MGRPRNSEEGSGGPGGDDQVVIIDFRTVFENDLVSGVMYLFDLAVAEINVGGRGIMRII